MWKVRPETSVEEGTTDVEKVARNFKFGSHSMPKPSRLFNSAKEFHA